MAMNNRIVKALSWIAFFVWVFLTFVRVALWFGFAFNPACNHPWMIVASLICYSAPLVLYIWVTQFARQSLPSFMNTIVALLFLFFSEALVARATEANAMEVILWQSLVLIVMFLSARSASQARRHPGKTNPQANQ